MHRVKWMLHCTSVARNLSEYLWWKLNSNFILCEILISYLVKSEVQELKTWMPHHIVLCLTTSFPPLATLPLVSSFIAFHQSCTAVLWPSTKSKGYPSVFLVKNPSLRPEKKYSIGIQGCAIWNVITKLVIELDNIGIFVLCNFITDYRTSVRI